MQIADLNAAQRRAVTTRSGPLLVLAGAGTGKTRVITYRIAELIRRGVLPHRILAVTFTNKAAREMRDRALALLVSRRSSGRTPRAARATGRRDKKTGPEISTFHSLCVRILRRHIVRLGYPERFVIYDQSDQEGLARAALRDLRAGSDKLRPSDLLWFIGGYKTRSITPDQAVELASSDREELAAAAYGRYQSALEAAGALDFDDLLLLTQELFQRFEDVRRAEAARFDHVLIDEYQDTNATQYRIVKGLAAPHRNLCVVGDDDQSIYAWRGAEVRHILGFTDDWPEATVVRLEDNYRCREAILVLSNTLIAHNRERHDKTLRASRRGGEPPRVLRFADEATEAAEVVRTIRERIVAAGAERPKAGEFAILFRTNEQPRPFEVELRRSRVPYVLVGGQSFYDRKEVRDVLAYLRVIANPLDEMSLLRVINTPRRGIGDAAVKALLRRAVDQGRPLWDVLSEADLPDEVPSYTAERIRSFQGLIEDFKKKSDKMRVADLAVELLSRVEYEAELRRTYKDAAEAEARWESVGDLVSALAGIEARADRPSLSQVLDETALDNRREQDETEGDARNAVTLMTLHSAKGLEFSHVFMVGMEEGLLPHKRSVAEDGGRAIAEERRLCYVGITRARETLTFTFCKARMKWGVLRPQIPSRFLMEMKGDTEKAEHAAEAAASLAAGVKPENVKGIRRSANRGRRI